MDKVMFEQKTIEEALDAAETAVRVNFYLRTGNGPSDLITLMIMDFTGVMYMKEFKKEILIQLRRKKSNG